MSRFKFSDRSHFINTNLNFSDQSCVRFMTFVQKFIANDLDRLSSLTNETALGVGVRFNDSYVVTLRYRIHVKVVLKWATWFDVVNIKSGQLALRFTPNGKSRAGLNNGNHVLLEKQEGIWAYVTVFKRPNKKVEGLKGWVNSNYLTCNDVRGAFRRNRERSYRTLIIC